jgi:hypothetical protein
MLVLVVACCIVAPTGDIARAGTVKVKDAGELTISSFTQARFEFQDVQDSIVNSSFFIRRSRMRLKAAVSDHAQADLEVDFASSTIVKDAYVGLWPNDRFEIRFGQFKKPFSQEELLSSSGMPTIDLGLTNGLTTGELGFSGRDQGLMVAAKDKKEMLQGWLGVFSGAGEGKVSKGDNAGEVQSLSQNRGKDLAARLAIKPAPMFQIAVNVSLKSAGATYSDSVASHSSKTFTAFGGDVKVEPSPGLVLWGEVLSGDEFSAFQDTLASFEAPTFLGFHIAVNYKHALADTSFLTAIQPEARFEIFDPNTDEDDDGSNLITAGLSLFFGDNVRWRNNVVIESLQESGADSQTKFVSELQGKI